MLGKKENEVDVTEFLKNRKQKKIPPVELQTVTKSLEKCPRFHIAGNAVARSNLKSIAMNWDRYRQIDHTFSNEVTPKLKITNQQKSGRCWIFAALNLMRIPFARKYKLKNFEFSQSYLFFWDKLEKANYFLEGILSTLDEPSDSRVVTHLIANAVSDGGQWDMFVSLVEKYGLVPKSVCPDPEGCLSSMEMNYILSLKLKTQAKTLRQLHEKEAKPSAIRKVKEKQIAEIYQILVTHFGLPITKFDWEYTDEKKKFHAHRNLTPQKFAKQFACTPLKDMVCLVHSPRKSTPLNKTYSVKFLGNVVEGQEIKYLNVPIDVMKKAAIASIKANVPIWFGCDVAKQFHREIGIMDKNLYNYEDLYEVDFEIDKAERMDYHESQMTHAMLFTGVNLVDDKPVKWKVENSWGEAGGDKGFFIMTDDWFDEYMFEIALEKRFLPPKILKLFEQKPKLLEPWDPLGALAH